MVLQITNSYPKATGDSENTPPNSTSKLSPKTSSVGSISATARRRRARANGTPRSPRYAVEQAKRRSTKSPPSVRFATLATPPPPGESDIEMQDATTASKKLSTTAVTLPRLLARPDYREPARAVITTIEPELAEIPFDYIQDGLESTGPAMMQVLSNIQADPVGNKLPKELQLLISDFSADMPTHMLAVYARSTPQTKRRVTLFPVHNIVLAAHCANLPSLPPSKPTANTRITVPVVPLCLPHPQTFSALSSYLYSKRADQLLAALLPAAPTLPSSPTDSDDAMRVALSQLARTLAATYTAHALLQRAMVINGLWRNVCALGIFDDKLWSTMDVAWEVVLNAMMIATGQSLPSSEPASTASP